MNALISVVIPCFNARLWIAQTLQSVLSQEMENYEIIAVDDGSTDGTADFIEREFSQVHLVRTPNGGPSRARNIGTEKATGRFIQYLDADDLLAPQKLRRQWEVLEKSGGDVAYGDWQKLVMTSDGTYQPGEVMRPCLSSHLGDDVEIEVFNGFWCPPAAYLFRREAIEKVGGWNESLPVIQDARFALDCAFHGAQFVPCEGLMAMYRVHTSGSVSTRDARAFSRDCLTNNLQVEERWRSCGKLDTKRKKALVKAYDYVAQVSYRSDPKTFERAYARLAVLDRRYVPEEPLGLNLATRFLGYRRAQAVKFVFGRIKSAVRSPKPS